MKLLNFLEKKFGKFAIRNLTYYLIGFQILAYFLTIINPAYAKMLTLQTTMVMQGQIWRLVTFLFVPFTDNPIFVVFTWYLYYLIGSVLEREWGSFRYMVYLAISYILTIIISFVFPKQFFSNEYLYSSIFLAFAYLYPNFQLMLFFIIPVKVKWFALLIWIVFIASVLFGSVSSKILAIVSLLNFFLFFGQDMYLKIKNKKHHISYGIKNTIEEKTTYMKCVICGKTEKDNLIFYNCNECVPDTTYCEDHIDNHKHKK